MADSLAVYDSVDRHMADADAVDKAALAPGIFLAWCVNLGLESRELNEQHERAVLRLRYREITGSEFLVAACGGVLDASALGENGRRFADNHYEAYLDALREFAPGGEIYSLEDDWNLYDRMAAVLTRRYMGRQAPSTPWWKFWK